jgi:hypothetical protein
VASNLAAVRVARLFAKLAQSTTAASPPTVGLGEMPEPMFVPAPSKVCFVPWIAVHR